MEVVIIPSYNKALYIKSTLDCIYEKAPDMTVYLCDNCSDDDTITILWNYQKYRKPKNLKIFRCKELKRQEDIVGKLVDIAKENGFEKFVVLELSEGVKKNFLFNL